MEVKYTVEQVESGPVKFPQGATLWAIEKLKPYERNARTHSQEQVEGIAASILEFGFLSPILIDEVEGIIAGHGRLMAANYLGLKHVSVLIVTHLTPAQKRAYVLVDNQLALNAGWDEELLAQEVEALGEEGEVDIELLGFADDELTRLLDGEPMDRPMPPEPRVEAEPREPGEPGEPRSSAPSTGAGEPGKGGVKGSLVARFIVPPFSVLDTRQGYWQERKDEWLKKTGNLSLTKENALAGDVNLLTSINEGSSNFDPVLAELFYRWFNVPDGKILDPFGGEQTKGVVAGELGYPYQAVEFRLDQVDVNKRACSKYTGVNYTCGDSNNISTLVTDRNFDFCFTSPPYYDLEVYSKDDMSGLGTYEEFMRQYENIFKQCFEMLADNRFLAVKVGEIRDKKTGEYRNFVGDNITIFKRLGFKYYNEVVLLGPAGTAPMRANKYMTNRKLVKLHQNVLVFYKGDLKQISANFPALTFNEPNAEGAASEPKLD